MSKRKRREITSRVGSEKLGDFKPRASSIRDIGDLLSYGKPKWSTDTIEQYEFFEYLRACEMVINSLTMAMVNSPRVSTVQKYAVHIDALRDLHDDLLVLHLSCYRSTRLVQKSGDSAGTSAAMLISLVLCKIHYLERVLHALQRVLRRSHMQPTARISFQAPFLQVRVPTRELMRGSEAVAAAALTVPKSMNGDVKIPKPYGIIPRTHFPRVYGESVMPYPNVQIGEYTQFQLYQQLISLSDRWHKLDLSESELHDFVRALYGRYAELHSLSFGHNSLELDMADLYQRPETYRGRDPNSIRSNKELQFLKDSISIEDSQLTKEQRMLKKRQLQRFSSAARYQIEAFGMITNMLSDIDFATRCLAPSSVGINDSRNRFVTNFVASVIRYCGGGAVLQPKDNGLQLQDGELSVPMPYRTEQPTHDSNDTLTFATHLKKTDYLTLFGNLRAILNAEQERGIDDSTKKVLCESLRHAILPLGIKERYCMMNQMVWSDLSADTETTVVVRAKLNFQLRYWESYPSSYFLSDDQPLAFRLLFMAHTMNAVCAQDGQKRPWAKDAVVCASTCDVGQVEQICNVRKAPFVLQFGRRLYLKDGNRFYECANISEAFLSWITLMYGIYNAVPPSRGIAQPRLQYVDKVIDELIGKLPEAILVRFTEWVGMLQKRQRINDHASIDNEQQPTTDEDDNNVPEQTEDDEVPWLQPLFY